MSSDPVEDVVNFIRSYEERYGNIHPVFYQGSYSQALSDAKQELRFLLVYLHKDEAQDIDQWCRWNISCDISVQSNNKDTLAQYKEGYLLLFFFFRNTLCDPEVIRYINTHTLFWACNVKSGEGYKVAEALKPGSYPFLTLIVLKDNKMTIVGRYVRSTYLLLL